MGIASSRIVNLIMNAEWSELNARKSQANVEMVNREVENVLKRE